MSADLSRCEAEIAAAVAHQQAHGPSRDTLLWEMDWREELAALQGVTGDTTSEAGDTPIASTAALKAPFPWFGGKSRVSHLVWQRFGDVANYVEPFFGSGAVLLGRPGGAQGIETVNDKDGFLSNFWRAVAYAPDEVARHADWPVNENDLHARHAYLLGQRAALTARLEGDPGCYDARLAGWWVWGLCAWIGGGWCSGDGPWQVDAAGHLVKHGGGSRGITRRLPSLGNAGVGINRQVPHLSNAGQGVYAAASPAHAYLSRLAARLRRVRVACGDWQRVTGPSVTVHNGLTGVFLDPPYSSSEHDVTYAADEADVSAAVREWAIANGGHPQLRIGLCGYAGEHAMPADWTEVAWKAQGGYGSQGQGRGRDNAKRERIWFSPHCLGARQTTLF